MESAADKQKRLIQQEIAKLSGKLGSSLEGQEAKS
jgi:hypothetical protein